jgi:hypothetical protein
LFGNIWEIGDRNPFDVDFAQDGEIKRHVDVNRKQAEAH